MNVKIIKATKNDLREILKIQKLSYQQQAEIYNNYNIPPLTQTYNEIMLDYDKMIFLKAIKENKIIGSVRAYEENNSCYIGRLFVHPDFQKKGIGKKLIKEIENKFQSVNRYELFTGHKSIKNIHLYKKLGYKEFKREKYQILLLLYI